MTNIFDLIARALGRRQPDLEPADDLSDLRNRSREWQDREAERTRVREDVALKTEELTMQLQSAVHGQKETDS